MECIDMLVYNEAKHRYEFTFIECDVAFYIHEDLLRDTTTASLMTLIDQRIAGIIRKMTDD